MAKSKNIEVPIIKTNSALMGWLNGQAESEPVQSAGEVAGEGPGEPPAVTGNKQKDSENPQLELPAVSQADKAKDDQDQETATEAVSHSQAGQPTPSALTASTEAHADPKQKSPITKGAKPGKEKTAAKPGATAENVELYFEQYFKKPEREGVTKPVQLAEDKHWMLTLLIDSARREGWRLTLPDLIDNLIAHHISDNKEVVDKLIAQWKARKNLG